jgi:hypothetical protein
MYTIKVLDMFVTSPKDLTLCIGVTTAITVGGVST